MYAILGSVGRKIMGEFLKREPFKETLAQQCLDSSIQV